MIAIQICKAVLAIVSLLEYTRLFVVYKNLTLSHNPKSLREYLLPDPMPPEW